MAERSLRTVLVTGAEGFLGKKVAEKFLSSGCHVIGTSFKDHSQWQDASQRLSWMILDLADSRAVARNLDSLTIEVDGLVHCAGGFRWAPLDQLKDHDLNFLMDCNLRSAFNVTRALLPGMKSRNFGRIVLVSARATLQGATGMAAYAASKAGLNLLTESLADEVRSSDININAVLPSIIDTPANRKEMASADFSKWVTAEALAEIIFSLTQPWGKPIHGALIPVSGRV